MFLFSSFVYFFFFLLSNGWSLKKATHSILGILVVPKDRFRFITGFEIIRTALCNVKMYLGGYKWIAEA